MFRTETKPLSFIEKEYAQRKMEIQQALFKMGVKAITKELDKQIDLLMETHTLPRKKWMTPEEVLHGLDGISFFKPNEQEELNKEQERLAKQFKELFKIPDTDVEDKKSEEAWFEYDASKKTFKEWQQSVLVKRQELEKTRLAGLQEYDKKRSEAWNNEEKPTILQELYKFLRSSSSQSYASPAPAIKPYGELQRYSQFNHAPQQTEKSSEDLDQFDELYDDEEEISPKCETS